MFLLLKLNALFTALKALAAKFPDARVDAGALFADLEAAVLTKTWTLAAIEQTIADAEKLVSDAVNDWTGSQAEVAAFVTAFKALFA